ETSRYDLVQALVDEHTTRIDRTHDNTGDKAFYKGHWYSDKAPGGALLGVPAYAALRGVAALTGAQPTRWQYWRACAFLGAVAPAILLVLLLLRFLRAYVDEWWALTIALGYALGTIAYPFASLYFSHVAAACFLFASFFVLWRTPPGSRRWPLLLAGLLAGWAVLLEYPAALGVVALLIYAGARERRAPFLMALGALPPALILLGYNWISFGARFAIGYSKLTDPYFRSGMSQGFAGVTWPKPGALARILAGPRGLLRLSPWLAAAPFGLWSLRRPGAPRRELALGGAIAGLFLLYNAGYYQPLGGTTPGPRFLIAALPFFALLAAFAPRASRPLIATMIVCSVALLLLATLTAALPSQHASDPLADVWLPQLAALDLTNTTASLAWRLTGGLPLLVLVLALGCALLALFATTRPQAAVRRLALGLTVLLAAGVLFFSYPLDLVSKADTSKLSAVPGPVVSRE
ncbi:MAG TPA: hypothetical protein VFU78_04755, partial [Thermomicrobiales bacterium]|nr:hypothetical protein [Thermomicrobiales bacterium]